MHDARAPLHLLGSATAREAARLRREFTTWLQLDVPADPLDDIVLAVYESLANATDHAYANHLDDPGPIQLTARRSHDSVLIVVTDEGLWRIDTGGSFRGRGLALMRELVRDLHIASRHAGTIVYLRTPCPQPV